MRLNRAVGVISDTHGHVDLTRPAVRMLESLEVETVLHCGDIGSMAVVELFAAWPTHFVFGNCDENTRALAAAIRGPAKPCHGLFGDLEFDGVQSRPVAQPRTPPVPRCHR